MRHVGPTRVELGTRTIFNLLGPLSNPAGVSRQLLGVYSPEWVEPLAHVLKALGSKAAWVVHGDGLDEVTTSGVTKVAELKDGEIRTFELRASDAGLAEVTRMRSRALMRRSMRLRCGRFWMERREPIATSRP